MEAVEGATKGTIDPFEIKNGRDTISFAIEKRDVKTRELLDGAAFALYADEDCEEEKIEIARRHLVPKELEANGMKKND